MIIEYLKENGVTSFLMEVEGKEKHLKKFIEDSKYQGELTNYTLLKEDADKRSYELRIYFTPQKLDYIKPNFVTNNGRIGYDKYKYRINDNKEILKLFSQGYSLGINNI